MRKPGFWRLAGAYGVDLIILSILNYLGCWVLVLYFNWDRLLNSNYPWGLVLNFFVLIFLNAGYFTVFEWKGGNSLGKKIFHLKLQIAHFPGFRVFGAYCIDAFCFFVAVWGWGYCVDRFLSHLSMEMGIGLFVLGSWILLPFLICFYYSVILF